MQREEYAMVLDFLPNGYIFDKRPSHLKTPIIQAIGKTSFALLELVPKKDVFVQPHETVYIGEGKRDKIHHINGRLPFDKLTSTAREELKYVVEELVKDSEKEFMVFFNKARAVSTRLHQLELLPGLGKKRMWEIIEARDEKPFESYDELKKRVRLMPDPRTLISKRILDEIMGKEKFLLFVKQ